MTFHLFKTALAAALVVSLTGCARTEKVKADPTQEAPPPAKVESAPDPSIVTVDKPERFPLVASAAYTASSELTVTGQVFPDVSKTIPVVSLSTGRVVEIHARLGDEVKKGQLLLKIRSSDISGAYSDYRKAVVDETLAKAQLDRARVLLDKGAIPAKDYEVAKDTADKARVDVETTEERLRLLGVTPANPTPIVDIFAPANGVIIEQNITASGGVKTLDNSPNLFTIADLSSIWVICDVYENQLPNIRMGEYADIKLAAYPNETFHGRISNIGPILDPNLRTAKVRLELPNTGKFRAGMFVSAVFKSDKKEQLSSVPATAILHLHDRDWVYTPMENGRFRRMEVSGGAMLPGNMQEVRSGLAPGTKVVANALVLQNAGDQ